MSSNYVSLQFTQLYHCIVPTTSLLGISQTSTRFSSGLIIFSFLCTQPFHRVYFHLSVLLPITLTYLPFYFTNRRSFLVPQFWLGQVLQRKYRITLLVLLEIDCFFTHGSRMLPKILFPFPFLFMVVTNLNLIYLNFLFYQLSTQFQQTTSFLKRNVFNTYLFFGNEERQSVNKGGVEREIHRIRTRLPHFLIHRKS